MPPHLQLTIESLYTSEIQFFLLFMNTTDNINSEPVHGFDVSFNFLAELPEEHSLRVIDIHIVV